MKYTFFVSAAGEEYPAQQAPWIIASDNESPVLKFGGCGVSLYCYKFYVHLNL